MTENDVAALMRGIPNAKFAAEMLRQLADAIERDDARLTEFNNSVFGNDKGRISLAWERVYVWLAGSGTEFTLTTSLTHRSTFVPTLSSQHHSRRTSPAARLVWEAVKS